MGRIQRVFLCQLLLLCTASIAWAFGGAAFTENRGQWDERVLYKTEGAGGLTWWIERDGFTVLYSKPDLNAEPQANPRDIGLPAEMRSNESKVYPRKGHALKFKFVSVPSASLYSTPSFYTSPETEAAAKTVIPSDRLSHNNNYFLGNDPCKWAPDCGNFAALTCKDVWPGIDVEWYDKNGLIEFDFVIDPGADPNQIQMRVDGLDGELELVSAGEEIILPTSIGAVRVALPEAYQLDDNGDKSEIAARFGLTGETSIGIQTPEGYDAGKTLIVDPLIYGTYLGGGHYDYGSALTSDGAGGVIAAGSTPGWGFPTTEGAYQVDHGGDRDAFIARLSPDGREAIYCTFLGGAGFEDGFALAADPGGGVFVAGQAGNSGDFPITDGAFQEEFAGGNTDGFIAHLSAEGNELTFCTFLGGNSDDAVRGIISDGDAVIIAGYTSGNFPVTDGAFDESFNGADQNDRDAFFARLSGDGSELDYGTYLGGGRYDIAHAIAPDAAGGVAVAGYTQSSDFATTEGAFDRTIGGNLDAFVARFSDDGSDLIYSTYLGGDSQEIAWAIASDGEGGAVVAGYTFGGNFPTTENAYQRNYGGGELDAFATRFSEDGDMIYSTFLGGSYLDAAYALTPDGGSGVVVAGFGKIGNFPTTNGAYQRNFGGGQYDAFIARLSGDGSELIYGTYLGGSNGDEAYAIALDGEGGVFVAGTNNGGHFPTTEGAFQEERGNYSDAFVARLKIGLPFVIRWAEVPREITVNESQLVEFEVSGESYDENAELSIAYTSDNLPDVAEFIDHGDGSGTLSWQTDFFDAGNYSARFSLSNGVNETSVEVAIIVNNVNRAPLWSEVPDTVRGDETQELNFELTGSDPDADSMSITVPLANLPEGWQFADSGNGSGTFVWTPTEDDAGIYDATFTLSDGDTSIDSAVHFVVRDVNSTPQAESLIPDHFYLSANFPNPFNAVTRIKYGLPVAGEFRVDVLDLSGRRVMTLADGHKNAGNHVLAWRAEGLTTGVYLIHASSPSGFDAFSKAVLLK